MKFATSVEQVWDGLMFYEHIPRRPPLPLRLLLPAPLRAEGRRSAVGDETRCIYRRGHLVKRTTRIEPWRHYGFEVIEQELAIGLEIRLLSGGYNFRQLADGTTQVELETRYLGGWRPRWFWRAIETIVCHAFHRHILGAMRRDAESRSAPESISATSVGT